MILRDAHAYNRGMSRHLPPRSPLQPVLVFLAVSGGIGAQALAVLMVILMRHSTQAEVNEYILTAAAVLAFTDWLLMLWRRFLRTNGRTILAGCLYVPLICDGLLVGLYLFVLFKSLIAS